MEFIYIFWTIFILCILGGVGFFIYALNEPAGTVFSGKGYSEPCTQNSDCASEYCYTSGLNNSVCKYNKGQSCTEDDQCGSLTCVNSICGGSPGCDGTFENCPIPGSGCVSKLISVPTSTSEICLYDAGYGCSGNSDCASNSCMNNKICSAFAGPLEVCYSGSADTVCFDGSNYGQCLTPSRTSPSVGQTGYCVFSKSQETGDYCNDLFPCDTTTLDTKTNRCLPFLKSNYFTCQNTKNSGEFGEILGDIGSDNLVVDGCLPGLKQRTINGKTICFQSSKFITDLGLSGNDFTVGSTSGYMPSNIFNTNAAISSFFQECGNDNDCPSNYNCVGLSYYENKRYCVNSLNSGLPYSSFDASEQYLLHSQTIYDTPNYFILNNLGKFQNFNPNDHRTAAEFIICSFKGVNSAGEYFGVTRLDPDGNIVLSIIQTALSYLGEQVLNNINTFPIENIILYDPFKYLYINSPYTIVKSFNDRNGLRHVISAIDSKDPIEDGYPYSVIFYGAFGNIFTESNNSLYPSNSYDVNQNEYATTYYSNIVIGGFIGNLPEYYGYGPMVKDPLNYYYTFGDFAIATTDDTRIIFGSTRYSPRWMTYIVCVGNDVYFYTLDINFNLVNNGNEKVTNVCNYYSTLPPYPSSYNSIRRIVYWGSGQFDFAYYDASFYNLGYDQKPLIPGTKTTDLFLQTIVFNVSPDISKNDFSGSWNLISGVNESYYISRFSGRTEVTDSNGVTTSPDAGKYDRTWFYLRIPSQYYGGLENIDFCLDVYSTPNPVTSLDSIQSPIINRIKVAVSGFSKIASEITKILIWDSDLNGGLRSQQKLADAAIVTNPTINERGAGFHNYVDVLSDLSGNKGPAFGGLPNKDYPQGTNFWYEAPGNFSASTTMQFIDHQLCVFSGGRPYYVDSR